MVDPSSDRVSRAPPYSYSRFKDFGFRLRGCHALRPDFPVGSATLVFLTLPGGLLPFRSPLLRESRLISFPGLLRWFTSPSVAPPPYFIQVRGAGITPGGLPHSDIRGSQDMCSSPPAFRSLSRPSSPVSSRASAMDLYSLGHMASSPYIFVAFTCIPSLYISNILGSGLTASSLLLGQTRVELVTPALSERCSNQLSYCPVAAVRQFQARKKRPSCQTFCLVPYTGTSPFS